jgi:hypothetical protein
MFRKALVSACAALLLASGLSWGQNTSSHPIDFDIINPQSDDTRIRLAPDAYLMAGNTVGSLVSAWSTNASVDSILSYTNGQDRYWDVSIERFYANDSTAVLKVEEKETQSDNLKATYRKTISWKAKPNVHIEDDLGGSPLGLNVVVCAASTVAAVSPATRATWRWKLYLTQKILAKASSVGSVATYSLPDRLDSLTILTSDTLEIGDTTYTAAIPGNYGYVVLFVNHGGVALDTLNTYAVDYQVKLAGSDWSGPLDIYGNAAYALLDSVTADSGSVRSYRAQSIPADSVRYRIRALSNVGSNIIEWVKALWRD